MLNPRQTIIEAAAARDIPLTYLSRMIGRNTTWLHQYVAEQSPRVLPEFERRLLAMALDVDERSLGARDPWSPMARPL